MEIGSTEGYHTEKEFECGYHPSEDSNAYYVDVVWKKNSHNDHPAYAFEVHLSGNLEHALTLLKTANDKWNCKVILVTTGVEMQKARLLLETTFRDISSEAKLVEIVAIEELHEKVQRTRVLRDMIGYRTFPH
jgi:pyruvate dehydrogenase complex dehydrogenase (E1) component